MILQVAWRNIWRNKVRSFVVIIAIALGLWAGLFASAFVEGMMLSKVNALVETEVSHIQIHQKGFLDDKKIKDLVLNEEEIRNELSSDDRIESYTSRYITQAMIQSTRKTGAVQINAIKPEEESELTKLNKKIVEGDYFEGIKRNPIIISSYMAENYSLELRSKLVLTFQNYEGDITAGAFRVCGIYKSDNNMYDKVHIFIKKQDFAKIAEIEAGVHEIAILLKDHNLADTIATQYQNKYSTLEVLPWLDIVPGMRYMTEIFGTYLYIIVGIILTALLFSIVNTMFMAVLERVREIGMLMAIGMTKGKVFLMIMTETIIMSMIGCPLGIIVSILSINYFGNIGIDLSGAAYESVGFGSIIYPVLEYQSYVDVAIMVFIMSIIAAIFPARKALKLKPVEAIRKI